MRILHIINSLELGGAEALLHRLCTIKQSQCQHTVVSLGPTEPYGSALESQGVKVIRLQANPLSLYRVRREIRRYRPDVIQGWMYRGAIVATLVGVVSQIPVAWGIHCAGFNGLPWRSRTLIKLTTVLANVFSPHVVSCSRAGLAAHQRIGYPLEQMTVIANGVDVQTFNVTAAARLRDELDLPDDWFLVGTISRWHPQKDIPNLLAALERLNLHESRAWHCILIGSNLTNVNHDLARAIDDRGLTAKVTLYGPVLSGLPAVISALDVHVLPSIEEAFPNVILEAMACETPCITTDTGDSSLIIGDTGWVCPVSDPDRLEQVLRAAMDEHLKHPRVWKRRQRASRTRIVENFSLQTMHERYLAFWAKVSTTAKLS